MKKWRTRYSPGPPFRQGRGLSGVEQQPQRRVRSWRGVRLWGYSPFIGQSREYERCVSHSARVGAVIEDILWLIDWFGDRFYRTNRFS
jgi:hypothetical protein